ncbi:LOW QUALITY PROTEIN: hypothetical protein MSG28_004214 [Choristoneura fumiferana]|uniref:Uncharacterized protein n=1 Tax=Choristoneura fumiferana TaxID=7141 RepID=A0ACC0KJ39_CHOFU|nr:LOW QUALITY PROTEIN: hypothetical protein MSG28_004214 [Choristoneura fumiferana]
MAPPLEPPYDPLEPPKDPLEAPKELLELLELPKELEPPWEPPKLGRGGSFAPVNTHLLHRRSYHKATAFGPIDLSLGFEFQLDTDTPLYEIKGLDKQTDGRTDSKRCAMASPGAVMRKVPPSIIDNMTSTDMVVREGSDVSLVCRASGYPEPYVMWRREDGQDFNYNGESVSVVDGETLTITKVSRLHMGAYLCIASNGVPPSISKRIMLMVQFPPMLSIPNQLEGAYIGQDVTLECHTEAYPSSINYWTTDRGDMIISGAYAETTLFNTEE